MVSFGAGEPDFDTPAHIKEAAKKALDAGATKYTQVEGTVPLRKAVATWIGKAHGFTIDPAEVIVSSGAKQSIYNAVFALLDEGDEVIIPAPYWVSYNDIVKLAGGRPVQRADQGGGRLPGQRGGCGQGDHAAHAHDPGLLAVEPDRRGLRRVDAARARQAGGRARTSG